MRLIRSASRYSALALVLASVPLGAQQPAAAAYDPAAEACSPSPA